MLTASLRAGKVGTGVILTAVVLLIGIVSVGYGYVGQSERALIVGLVITLAGVITGALQIIAGGGEPLRLGARTPGDRRRFSGRSSR